MLSYLTVAEYNLIENYNAGLGEYVPPDYLDLMYFESKLQFNNYDDFMDLPDVVYGRMKEMKIATEIGKARKSLTK